MYYITVKQSPMYKQMSLEDFLFCETAHNELINLNTTNTRTYEVKDINEHWKNRYKIDEFVEDIINKLKKFNNECEPLRNVPRKSLYREFKIPKKSGGLRTIDAPNDELKTALTMLKSIFENNFGALYHTSAFAYIKNRSTVDCVKRHQENNSKWFAKYDLSNFFGSTTLDFVMNMLGKIFPFSAIIENEEGYKELKTAIELSFLDGGLPQGTPISPVITNIMMIPIDFTISKRLRELKEQAFVYTRYADDFQVSSRYSFSFKKVESVIVETLKDFGAPFQLNEKKTRYGSSSGSNWNLGVMLNKDNNITVGYRNKQRFRAMIDSYILDKKNGIEWDKSDIRHLEGLRNYYRMVEKDTIDRIIEHQNNKFGVNVVSMIHQDLSM